MSDLRGESATDQERHEVFELSEAGRISNSDIASDKQLRTAYRELGSRSLYFFAKGILGYKDITKRTHKPVCDLIQDLTKRKVLVLLPRGCFKTTIGTIAFTIWYLINNPDRTVLIANQIIDNVEYFISEISQHLDGSNPRMMWLYPERIRPDGKWQPWTKRHLLLPGRDILSGTPSVSGIGTGTRAESRHYDIVINDDIIGEKAMSSNVEMTDAMIWHDYSISLSRDPSRMIERMYGTRWDMSDVYSVVLKDPEYTCLVQPAIDPVDGTLFFPERLGHEVLAQIRDRNFSHYMSQYMNDPQNPEALEFKKSWLRSFRLIQAKNSQGTLEPCAQLQDGTLSACATMDIGIFLDPAASGDVEDILARQMRAGRARKANNAIVVLGVDGEGRYFVLEVWAGRGKVGTPEIEIVDKLITIAKQWHGYSRKIYVEAFGAQASLITIFKMSCAQQGLSFPIEEIPRGIKKAKSVRIRTGVGAVAQNGQLYVRDIQDNFIMEFSQYGSGGTIDILDAASWGVLTLRRPPSLVDRREIREHKRKSLSRRLMSAGRSGY
jgi:hypothetical protein